MTLEELAAAVEKALGEIAPAVARAQSVIGAIAAHKDAVGTEITNLASQAMAALDAIAGSHGVLVDASGGKAPVAPADKAPPSTAKGGKAGDKLA